MKTITTIFIAILSFIVTFETIGQVKMTHFHRDNYIKTHDESLLTSTIINGNKVEIFIQLYSLNKVKDGDGEFYVKLLAKTKLTNIDNINTEQYRIFDNETQDCQFINAQYNLNVSSINSSNKNLAYHEFYLNGDILVEQMSFNLTQWGFLALSRYKVNTFKIMDATGVYVKYNCNINDENVLINQSKNFKNNNVIQSEEIERVYTINMQKKIKNRNIPILK